MKRHILELEFSIAGMLRFISHLELQHFMARLMLRAGLPVYFSQGFNPRPKISLPVPRSVGISSLDDRARIELEGEISADQAMEKIKPLLPFEMVINRVWISESDSLQRAEAIEWEIDLSGCDTESIQEKIKEIERGPVLTTRQFKKTNKEYTIDLRPLILEISFQNQTVRAKIAYTPQGSIKPGELLQLLGLPKPEFLPKMKRIKTYWN